MESENWPENWPIQVDQLIFQKSLKKKDVASRFSVPSKCLKKLSGLQGRYVVDLRVRDKRGTFWKFRCFIRKTSHPKPVLSGDWHRFAVNKGLNIGDEVKLLEEIDQATRTLLHYRVEVKKAINLRLFGVSIEHAPSIAL
ncbi:hypothetical protein TIFTF001_001390 [Ficus carica]|uniref:TF-B3 domain-containing protein n=1 Tax=Ficus carica TaxID=3494 RepID=A0AA87ZHU0_FICCA|nr:hypothetical protein TIFTF001_001390 [Ficus carica]